MADPNDEHRPEAADPSAPTPPRPPGEAAHDAKRPADAAPAPEDEAAAPETAGGTEPATPPRPPASRSGTLPGPLPLRDAASPPRRPAAPTLSFEAHRRDAEPEVPRPRASDPSRDVPLDRALGFAPIDAEGDGEAESTAESTAGPSVERGAPAASASADPRDADPRWAPIRGRRDEPVGARGPRPARSEPTLSFARGSRSGGPAVDRPAIDRPAIDRPAVDRPAVDRPKARPAPANDLRHTAGPSDPAGAVMRPLVPLVLLLLFEATVLPIGGSDGLVSPLRLLATPGTATFVAAVFFVLILVAAAVPISMRARAGLLSGLGVGLLGYAMVVASAAVAADVFDGQPALELLLRGPGAPRVVLLLAAVALPTAMFWRYLRPASVGARIVAGTALVLVAFAYLGLHALGLGATTPLSALVDAGRTAPFMGDRVAAWVALLPALVALVGLLTFLPRRSRAMGRLAGALFWASVVAPVLVLALFVARMDRWQDVLEPLKVMTLLAAGLLLVPVGAGTLLATFERPDEGEADAPATRAAAPVA